MVEEEDEEERERRVGRAQLPRGPFDEEMEAGEEDDGTQAQRDVPSVVERLGRRQDEEVEGQEEPRLEHPHLCLTKADDARRSLEMPFWICFGIFELLPAEKQRIFESKEFGRE